MLVRKITTEFMSRPWLFVALLLLLISSSNIAAMGFFSDKNQAEPIKSENDSRQYQYLELDNQLKVLLISDPTTEKSAAALDVEVGSHDDPADREGLAHFLEHMLFLGTAKYPQADEYQTFISQNGGSHNAYTTSEHTNYFFDVQYAQLEPALDRFAQFFIEPLFTAEYVERESNAVHSEYRAKLKDGYRRQRDVLKEIINDEHPQVKFSVGNLTTLADRDNSKVRDDLLAFYQAYYSADRMTLVVLGRESLAELKAMVQQKFEAVALRKTQPHLANQLLFASGDLPQRVAIESLKDQRSLSLMFPIPPVTAFYRQKPLQYIGNILGHEGEGSLLSLLKQQGWAEALGAGGHADGLNEGWFSISISLTESGYANQATVVAAVFSAIEKLQTQGIEQWRFNEQKQLADISFRFSEKTEAINTVSYLAIQMQSYPVEDILREPYLFESFNAATISKYLDYLIPENMLWSIHSPYEKTDTVSELYQVSYRIEPLIDYKVERATVINQLEQSLQDRIRLPAINPFIPESVDLIDAQKSAEIVPQKILNRDRIHLWYQQDDKFKVPKAAFYARINAPVVGVSPRSMAISRLYTRLVKDQLNEFSYPALLAGLNFSVSANSRGFDVVLAGYNDRQDVLLDQILAVMKEANFDEVRFESLKTELLRSWRNSIKMQPYNRLFQEMPSVLFAPSWNALTLADALENVSFSDFNEFNKGLWQGRDITMLSYGNVSREAALAMAEEIAVGLNSRESNSEVITAKVVKLQANITPHFHTLLEHDDVVAALYLQARNTDLQSRADIILLRQLYNASFFNELRTEQQLGYIVALTSLPLKEVNSAVFLVQSPSASLSEVTKSIEQFLSQMIEQLSDFDLHKKAVIQQLLEPPKNSAEQSSFYWGRMLADDYEFDDLQLAADYLSNLTQTQFTEKLKVLLAQPSNSTMFDINALQAAWFTASRKPYHQPQTQPISDPTEFKRQSSMYLFQ